jgi:hypothetical protein
VHADKLSVAVAGPIPRAIRAALRILRRNGIDFEATTWNPHRAAQLSATAGYCGPGWEPCAPEMIAKGIPTLVAGPEQAREYIQAGETGFYLRDAKPRAIAERLESLATDQGMHARMARRAIDHARSHSWDTTAGLVLAAIENLSYEIQHVRPPHPRARQEVHV